MEHVTLKKCPFCGGDAELVDREVSLNGSFSEDVFQVFCVECSIEMGEFNSRDDAINKWNARV